MSVRSMTGFARSDGSDGVYRWAWEIRTVNGKGLDLRFRFPQGFERLDPPTRERCAARLTRGSVQATLTIASEGAATRIRINDTVLDDVLAAADRLKGRIDFQPPTLDGLLSVRGVVELVENEVDEESRAALDNAVLRSLDRALDDLVAMRKREGQAIGVLLTQQLAEIGRLAHEAEIAPARSPDVIRARLSEQVSALLDASPAFDAARLHQEAVFLATKADIREEIDRLRAHVSAATALLSEGGAVGRRLDFLAQEFSRETNTLCSKANDLSVTTIGLSLKAVVDQFREQIQNLE